MCHHLLPLPWAMKMPFANQVRFDNHRVTGPHDVSRETWARSSAAVITAEKERQRRIHSITADARRRALIGRLRADNREAARFYGVSQSHRPARVRHRHSCRRQQRRPASSTQSNFLACCALRTACAVHQPCGFECTRLPEDPPWLWLEHRDREPAREHRESSTIFPEVTPQPRASRCSVCRGTGGGLQRNPRKRITAASRRSDRKPRSARRYQGPRARIRRCR